jgi:hypothetical protein
MTKPGIDLDAVRPHIHALYVDAPMDQVIILLRSACIPVKHETTGSDPEGMPAYLYPSEPTGAKGRILPCDILRGDKIFARAHDIPASAATGILLDCSKSDRPYFELLYHETYRLFPGVHEPTCRVCGWGGGS